MAVSARATASWWWWHSSKPSHVVACCLRAQCRAIGTNKISKTEKLRRRRERQRKVPDPEQHHVTAAAMEKGLSKYFCNRNPRSPELLGIAPKPRGFGTRRNRVDYYHRLMLEFSTRHISAYINHNSGLKVVEASTKEFCISQHLYKSCDESAACNVARVLAHRCKQSGLNRVMWQSNFKYDPKKHKKVRAFIRAFAGGGVFLNEPKVRTALPPAGTLPNCSNELLIKYNEIL